MVKLLRNKIAIITISLLLIVIFVFAFHQGIAVDKAHATFENYYAFRGCAQLLNRTADSGECKTNSGQTIKIVKFNNKWYLDGDLPICWKNICI